MTASFSYRTRLRDAGLGCAMLLIGTAMVTGCTHPIETHGNLPDSDQVVQINPGVDDKNHVSQLLGSPSTVSPFGGSTWYYISKKTEQVAFLDPDVLDQEVLSITFDDQDIVKDMKIYGLENGRIVEPVDRVTPTQGSNLTVLQQLLGNLGRFNTKDKKSTPY
jgi:outer membrane protein assembly factor BamE (lipoprotein component of BamABCDE complex)